jgi:hypothetical protein
MLWIKCENLKKKSLILKKPFVFFYESDNFTIKIVVKNSFYIKSYICQNWNLHSKKMENTKNRRKIAIWAGEGTNCHIARTYGGSLSNLMLLLVTFFKGYKIIFQITYLYPEYFETNVNKALAKYKGILSHQRFRTRHTSFRNSLVDILLYTTLKKCILKKSCRPSWGLDFIS